MVCNCIYETEKERWFFNQISNLYKKGYYRIVDCEKGMIVPYNDAKKLSLDCKFRCAAGQIDLFEEFI